MVQRHRNSSSWCLQGGTPNNGSPGFYTLTVCAPRQSGVFLLTHQLLLCPSVQSPGQCHRCPCPLWCKGSAPCHGPFPEAPTMSLSQGTTCSSHCSCTPSYLLSVYSSTTGISWILVIAKKDKYPFFTLPQSIFCLYKYFWLLFPELGIIILNANTHRHPVWYNRSTSVV